MPSRPGTEKGAARWVLDRAVDAVRDKFGRESVGYGSVALRDGGSVPDDFRELADILRVRFQIPIASF